MNRLLLLAALLLHSVLPAAPAEESVPTFEHRDPFTGETLSCAKCPPGTHVVAHCTASTPTQCAPCGEDRFTALWNYLPRCLYCSNFCSDNEEVETECSPTTNRVCRCRQGFYRLDDFCVVTPSAATDREFQPQTSGAETTQRSLGDAAGTDDHI